MATGLTDSGPPTTPRSKSKKSGGIKSKDVINRTGGVQTEDGRTLFGMDAETYLRIKAKEDPELERKTGEWIEDVLGKSIPDPSDLWKSLKDGVILCELLNKIQPGVIRRYATPKGSKPLHVLQERENINQYLEACYKLGMSRDALFVTSDLHGRQGMSSVIQNLTALSQKVKYMQAPGVSASIEPIAPAKSFAQAKDKGTKWNVATDYLTPVMTGDLDGQDDIQAQYQDVQNQLKETRLQLKKIEAQNEGLKSDLASYREKLRQGDNPSIIGQDDEVATLRAEIEKLKAQITEHEESSKRRRKEKKPGVKGLSLSGVVTSDPLDSSSRRSPRRSPRDDGSSRRSPRRLSVGDASQELAKLTEELTKLKDENNKLQQEIQVCVTSLLDRENEANELKARQAKLEQEKRELEETNETLEKDIVALLEQVESAPVVDPLQVETLTNEKNKLLAEQQRLKDENRGMSEDINELLKDIDSKQEKTAAAFKRDQEIIQQLENTKMELENNKNQLIAEKERLFGDLDEVKQRLQQVSEELKQIQIQNQNSTKELIQQHTTKLNSAEETSNTLIGTLKREIENLKSQLDNTNKNLSDASQQYHQTTQSHIKRLEDELAQAVSANLKLKEEVTDKQQLTSKQQEQIANITQQLNAEAKQKASDLQAKEKEKVELQKMYDLMLAQKQSLQSLIVEKEVTIDKLSSDLTKLKRVEAENKRLAAEKDRTDQELRELQQTKAELEQQLAAFKATNSKLSSSSNRSSKKLQDAQKKNETLQGQNSQYQKDKDTLNQQNKELQKQLQAETELKEKALKELTREQDSKSTLQSKLNALLQDFDKLKSELLRRTRNEQELNRQVVFLTDANNELKEMLKPKPPPNPLFELLTNLMDTLLHTPKKPKEEDIVKVKGVFKIDEGRRLFTSLLEKAITTSSGAKELSETPFELLLFLINSCLNELKLENGADYICAKIILQTAESIYRRAKTKTGIKDECILPFIQDHFVWENLNFWEEYFWDIMAKSFQSAFGETTDYQEIHKQFIAQKLEEFGNTMEGWGRLSKTDIQKFKQKIVDELKSETEESETESDSWGSDNSEDELLFANEVDSDTEEEISSMSD